MKSGLIYKIVVVLVLLAMLAACAPTAAPTAADTPSQPSEASAPQSDSAQVVRVLAVAGPETDALIAGAAEFEKQTGITASIEQVARPLWSERKVRELLQDSGIYDVVFVGGGDDLVWVKTKGHVLPLDDYLSEETKSQMILADTFTQDGKLIGAPQYFNFPMLFYRKDLLEDPQEQADFKAQYGRDLTVPKTYDELLEVAEFFNRPPEMSGYCLGGVDWSVFLDYTYYLYGTGGNFGDLETGELTLNSPEAVRAMDVLTRLTEFNPKGWETMSFFDCDTQVQQGKVFMYQNWFYIWSTLSKDMPDQMAIAPVTGDVQPGAHLGAFVAVIPTAAPSPEAAGQFIEWMLNPDYQKEQTLVTGNMPVREDVLQDPEVRSALVGIEMYEQTIPYMTYQYTTWPNELDSGVTEAIWKVLKGEMTAQQAGDWLQNEKFKDRKAIE
ncbi:MAG: extracellular solute-binding protein [Chloroflexi bacterium]|nr:extracellular solute-binding protein [Anaerolineaceae bacterium]NMB90062.1 extracellular solute-binding protein [Chloroflexota bacterium]